MENRRNEPDTLRENDRIVETGERMTWTKPVLDEFGIAATTRNAGIINLDLDHALDIS
jgi:hypothetical protein